MKVSIYERPTSDNKKHLSLDYYINRKRIRRALGMFYYNKPKTQQEKIHNTETKIMLETIKLEKTIELQRGEHGIIDARKKYNDYIDYFSSLTNSRKEIGANFSAWKTTLKHLKNFEKNGIGFNQLNTDWIVSFRDYLQHTLKLSSSSVMVYFKPMKISIHQAYRDKLIKEDYAVNAKGIKVKTAQRQFLTAEEIINVCNAECDNTVLKKAFIFSLFTGIAFADIKNMTWKQITKIDNQWYFTFHRKKTNSLQYNPISNDAREMLGESKNAEENIFNGLNYSAWNNLKLREWMIKAGISNKKITFHCARHTYATQILSSGADITTVMNMLGHKELKTTMLYAKIIDSHKITAANSMSFESLNKKIKNNI